MSTAKNLMVKALAGTGKTSTMIWSVGSIPRNVQLSAEQTAIRDWVQAQKIAKYRFLAFNKSIATELAAKVPSYCEAATCHSSGLSIIKMNHGRGIKVDSWKYRNIIDKLFGEPKKPIDYVVRNAVGKVLDLARCDLLGYENDGSLQLTEMDLATIMESADIDDDVTPDQLLTYANKSLAVGSKNFKVVDFSDMIWMPVFHQMKVSKVDGLIVDECQDLSRAQQGLVMMQGHQLICVGDVNQAIYGFAGADANSMFALEQMLGDRGGVDVMPLTVTRRCGKAIVAEAQGFVPEYKAADSNPDGTVRYVENEDVVEELKFFGTTPSESDTTVMVLCRTNAPLVSLAFKLLREEVRVIVRGRDIGQGLIKLVEKIAGKSDQLEPMLSNLTTYETEEEAKIRRRYKYGADEKIVALTDKVDCIRILATDCGTVTDLTNKLSRLFQDDLGNRGTIVLSSVHKAKGLEADTVYIYKPNLLPHPKLVDKANGIQEFNLRYVAQTRAISILTYCVDKEVE